MSQVYEYKLTTVKKDADFKSIKIVSKEDAVKFARQFYFEDINIFESVFLITLNRANFTNGWAKISQGGLSSTVLDIKIVAKICIDRLANSAILIHNHPSGNTKPSKSDKEITIKIKEALKLIDCELLDHLILTENNFESINNYI